MSEPCGPISIKVPDTYALSVPHPSKRIGSFPSPALDGYKGNDAGWFGRGFLPVSSLVNWKAPSGIVLNGFSRQYLSIHSSREFAFIPLKKSILWSCDIFKPDKYPINQNSYACAFFSVSCCYPVRTRIFNCAQNCYESLCLRKDGLTEPHH